MNVELTPDIERLIESKVRSGQYHSASDVVREALQLLEERELMLAVRAGDIRNKIAEGLQSLREGKRVDGEAVFDRLETELNESERHDRK